VGRHQGFRRFRRFNRFNRFNRFKRFRRFRRFRRCNRFRGFGDLIRQIVDGRRSSRGGAFRQERPEIE